MGRAKIEIDKFKSFFFGEVQAMKAKLGPGEKIMYFADWMELKGDMLNDRYPELCKLMQIALLLPVTSVDPERRFSTMNILKDDKRNTLSCKVLDFAMRLALCGPESVQEFFNSGMAKDVLRHFMDMVKRRTGQSEEEKSELLKYIETLY